MSSFVAWRGWPLSKKRFADERSLEAEAELDEIWIRIAIESGSSEIATRVVDNITERFWLLARSPFIGRRRICALARVAFRWANGAAEADCSARLKILYFLTLRTPIICRCTSGVKLPPILRPRKALLRQSALLGRDHSG